VLLAARARSPFAAFDALRVTPQRELPECVVEALEALDQRRFTRAGAGDVVSRTPAR
jgi:hypothetical protein